MQKTEFYFSSSDEIHDIHAVVWRPEGDVRAVLQISHGMTEYVNRYEELAEYLAARGILVDKRRGVGIFCIRGCGRQGGA